MKIYAIAYVVTLIVFLAIDFVWLSSMADLLYRPMLGDLIAPQFRVVPAVIFYLVYVAGLTFFAVRPGFAVGSVSTAFLYGAAFGFVAYATYDLTNQATLRTWSTTLTVADILWGSVLSAIASSAGQWVTSRIAGSL